jgi:hypothetical protein
LFFLLTRGAVDRTRAAIVRTAHSGTRPPVLHRLLTRLGGLAVVLTGIIIAVLHYWQPHAG